MLYETRFLISLFLTLIIEVPTLFFLIRFFHENKRISSKKIISSGVIASALTLPYLWFVLPPYINSNYYIYLGEVLILCLEALIYNQLLGLDIRKSFFASLVCNLSSFVIGLMIV
ncbi:MAG: hypothetical protein ABIH11_05980 [Candidatus Altiarchaeota archaeon]